MYKRQPSNTGYAQLFAASTISAQITDQSGKCIYQSQDSECIAPEIVRQVVQCPIMLENGIRLSGKPILGGYVLWKENLSELQEIVRELEDRKMCIRDSLDGIGGGSGAVPIEHAVVAEPETGVSIELCAVDGVACGQRPIVRVGVRVMRVPRGRGAEIAVLIGHSDMGLAGSEVGLSLIHIY